ncbi:GIGYF family protein CG11148 isoform X2 [Teleopsis dalmanni]|uniref:GIGYF family protein CG11148 isoform X2 n=1 Tax=Teleopsis dalmanni TaxID=139649 RepID=UPI0018CF9C6F|nr:GIGYF family protein CG11148 isoform X2 [Teleopsis dalmanni]
MTDSMKFGPEWLRNMSTDSNIASNISVSNNSNIGIISTMNSNHGASSKNLLPEFRYGREEMLSLFDKNCNMPDVLPMYKKLFIEKVQYPVALLPTSDDEMILQGISAPTQRSMWVRRSPVGFSSVARGGARGGVAERGRMRGKSLYHSIYQRQSVLVDEDTRTQVLKVDRNWTERNGESLGSTSGNINIGLDWNGSPVTSPRKEISNHTRNMENWRRNRNDSVLGDNNTGLNNSDGWRSCNNSNGFGNSNRWGRSTSWREDETSAPSTDIVYGSGNIAVQRSYSSIATTYSEKNGIKHPQNSSNFANCFANRIKGNTNNIIGNNKQWKNSSEIENAGVTDDNLPEWAIESPIDSGGTFDSSGAFHGSVEEESSPITMYQKNAKQNSCKDSKTNDNLVKNDFLAMQNEIIKTQIVENNINTSKSNMNIGLEKKKLSEVIESTEESIESCHQNKLPETLLSKSVSDDIPIPSEALGNIQNSLSNEFSDRMKQVADDMVEKLIMDDDTSTSNKNIEIVTDNEGKSNNSLISNSVTIMLNETAQLGSQQIDNVSSTPNTIAKEETKTMPAYNNVMPTDISSLQHNLKQQVMTLTPSTSTLRSMHNAENNSSNYDLWYYRDPQSKVQGPFTAIEMTEWYRAGYFNETLNVRRVCDTSFRTLGELIKICHGNMPFTNSQFIPITTNTDHVSVVNSLPVISQSHDKVQNSVHNDNREELKNQVTSAANSLCVAVKNKINSVDISQVLNIHFQMLQQNFIRHQEMLMLNELTKNEWFLTSNPTEKDAIIQQKLQSIVLPEYLTSLSVLSNALVELNPCAGNQLFSAIAESLKKDQLFAAGSQEAMSSNSNTYANMNDYILNSLTQHQHNQFPHGAFSDITENNEHNCGKITQNIGDFSRNSNEANMRVLQSGYPRINFQQKSQTYLTSPNQNDYNNSQQLIAHHIPHAPMIQMWLPQSNMSNSNLPMDLITQPVQHQPNQWSTGPLVGIPNSMITNTPVKNNHNLSKMLSNNTLWDVNYIEQKQKENINTKTNEESKILQSVSDEQEVSNEKKSINEQHIPPLPSNIEVDNIRLIEPSNLNQKQNNSAEKNQLKKKNKHEILTNTAAMATSMITSASKKKDEQVLTKKFEEEKRKDVTDEKRRQKEDKKRHQYIEENRRQLLEEKERQLQIQAQRRKALLGNIASATGAATTTLEINKNSKEPKRVPTSIAPWSSQNTVSGQTGPGLAEIQKAERRERRADQQRQTEMLEKQIRANAAAAAEANDVMRKWNASPIPVKSFAQIQAEEVKRLATEQQEFQRRKERDQNSLYLPTPSGSHSSNTSEGNVKSSPIWNNPKIWGSTANAAGFWEEPLKLSASNTSTDSGNHSSNSAKQTGTSSQKVTSNNQGVLASKPLKKSQTVTIMQHNGQNLSGKQMKPVSQQQNKIAAPSKQNVKCQPQKSETERNRKNNGLDTSKGDDYQNEFTNWCIKSLNNMNTKVDVPTFVTFLQDLESPYEVKDYVRLYLGENKEYNDFAKQFLERRSRYKNLQRAQNAHNDDMCKPAPAITPSGNDNADNKKRMKKNKMTKLDARILGFSVTAAEGRINVGDRDYVDAP